MLDRMGVPKGDVSGQEEVERHAGVTLGERRDGVGPMRWSQIPT